MRIELPCRYYLNNTTYKNHPVTCGESAYGGFVSSVWDEKGNVIFQSNREQEITVAFMQAVKFIDEREQKSKCKSV